MIEVYSTIAQQETEKRAKRQAEGIEAMRKSGNFERYGRPKALPMPEFEREYSKVLRKEIAPFQLIRELKLSKATYYRYKREYEKVLKTSNS